MKKHLAYYETEWPANIAELTAVENKPFVGYLKGQGVSYTVIPEPSLYEAVDLGLPSGTKWADRNVGATSPEDPGLYFQWGDIEATDEDYYTTSPWHFYSYKFGKKDNLLKYNNTDNLTTLELEDDTAHSIMGSAWVMPTADQYRELIDNTSITWIDIDNVEHSNSIYNLKGVRLTGRNGNSIYLPTSDERYADIQGMWTSDLNNTDYNKGQLFAFGRSGFIGVDVVGSDYNRSCYLMVRGVTQ